MTNITLYFAPDTCARVPMTALEEIGLPFKTELVAFVRGGTTARLATSRSILKARFRCSAWTGAS
jgi:hypothetical protein